MTRQATWKLVPSLPVVKLVYTGTIFLKTYFNRFILKVIHDKTSDMETSTQSSCCEASIYRYHFPENLLKSFYTESHS